jgi:hypothetical protein
MKKIGLSIVLIAIAACSNLVASRVQSSGEYLRDQLNESIELYEDSRDQLEKAKIVFWRLDMLKTPKVKQFAITANLFIKLLDEVVQDRKQNNNMVMTARDELRLVQLNNKALKFKDEIYVDLGMKSRLTTKKIVSLQN